MRRSLFLFLPILVLLSCLPAMSVQAQKSHTLGYCTNDLSGAEKMGVVIDARFSGAIYLPTSIMQRYKGGHVTRIRVALSEGIQKPSVWIRTSLTETSKVTQSVPQLKEGWNEVELNRPLAIDGSGLYVGFTYTQPAGVKGVYVQGEGHANSSWLAIDNDWDDFHDQGVGVLCVQAVVEADLSEHDLGVIEMTTDSSYYHAGGILNAIATVENLGTADMDGYTLQWSIDGKDAVGDGTTYGLLTPGNTRQSLHTFSLSGLDEGEHFVQLTLHPAGGDDEKVDNNTYRTMFYIFDSSYDRTVLLEHFTSLPCVNCPPVDKMLETAVSARNDVAWVAHHVGYRTDEFTLTASEPYLSFGVIGNPMVILDRVTVEGDTPAMSLSSTSADEFNSYIDELEKRPAFVKVDANLAAEGRQLTATVSGEVRSFFQNLYPRATVNVFLVEDDVPAQGSQAGDSSKKRHDNVLRAVLTRQSGDLPEWTDDTHFGQSYTAEAPDDWDLSHLRVVAFVTSAAVRSTGYPTGEVLNATQASATLPDGIRTAAAHDRSVRYYAIDGRPLQKLPVKGLYIIADGQGIRKVAVR